MASDQLTSFSIGPFRIERQLGSGGMGEVFEAYDERLDRRVALKVIRTGDVDRDRAQARFVREARAAAKLSHPSIVQIFDILETPSGPCLVLELIAGSPLRKAMETEGLALTQSVRLALDIAGALEAAHHNGIVHRDLKASNIIVTPEGRAKVLDFGIAKSLDDHRNDEELTLDGQVVGTPAAMSPEQAQGLQVTASSDLFSFGSLLYEMLSGTAPFLAADRAATIDRIYRHQPPPLFEKQPEIPRELDDLLQRLLSKDPADRPKSAAVVKDQLRAIQNELQDQPSTVTPVVRPDAPTEVDQQLNKPGGVATEERRQITLLCCDLVDDRGHALEPETLYGSLPDFRQLVRVVIDRFDGHIADDQGHRVELRFGYPMAHEDDARRAVYAALELASAVATLGAQHGGLALRAGVHTGPAVLVASAQGGHELMLGRTLEIASELRSSARPAQVLVSSITQKLIEGFFETGEVDISLPTGDIGVYDAIGGAGTLAHDTPTGGALLGRYRETDQVADHWRKAESGHGQILLISGEPGIGKSRLIQHMKGQIAADGYQALVAGSSPYHQGTPLYAMTDLFQREFEIGAHQPKPALDRLVALAEGARLQSTDAVPLLADALSLPLDQRFATGERSAQAQRSRSLEALVALLLNLADKRPMALVFEDLHWADPSTLELIEALLPQVETAPLLLVLTFRSDFELPWRHRGRVSQLHLDRLEPEEARALIGQVEGSSTLPVDLVARIIETSDGIPLFVEELTRHFLDLLNTSSAEGAELATSVPVSLRDALAARLDRLGGLKEVAQVASALGRRFGLTELAGASGKSESLLLQQLSSLSQSGLVIRGRSSHGGPTYRFRHALIQEAAYDSLLSHQRRALHQRISQTLEQMTRDGREIHPEETARHLEGAEQFAPAARAWLEAGQLAATRSAHREAIVHLRRGLRMTPQLPESGDRDRLELDLLTGLGASLSATKNYSVPEVAEVYERARILCERVDDRAELGRVLTGLWSFHLNRGHRAETEALTARLETEAANSGHPGFVITVSALRGYLEFYLGNFRSANDHLAQQAELFTADRTPETAEAAADPAAVAALYRGWAQWFLGRPETAWKSVSSVVSGTSGYTRGQALTAQALLAQFRNDPDGVEQLSRQVIEMAHEEGYDAWAAMGELGNGWALAIRDQDRAGLEQIESSLGLFQALRTGVQFGYYQAVLADACRALGEIDRGLAATEAGLEFARERLDGFSHAELCRLRGELSAQPADRTEWLSKAAQVAREQGSPMLELRALVRLSAEVQASERSRTLARLSQCYRGFDEGFSESDLSEAKQILSAVDS